MSEEEFEFKTKSIPGYLPENDLADMRRCYFKTQPQVKMERSVTRWTFDNFTKKKI